MVELIGRYSNRERLSEQLTILGNMQPRGHQPPRVLQRQIRLSADQQAELLERYLAGERAFILAKHYGVHRNTVRETIRRAGFQPRLRGLSPDQLEEAKRLRRQGWSYDRIGKKLGFNHGTVWLALRGLKP